jgi:hypothetical protein
VFEVVLELIGGEVFEFGDELAPGTRHTRLQLLEGQKGLERL